MLFLQLGKPALSGCLMEIVVPRGEGNASLDQFAEAYLVSPIAAVSVVYLFPAPSSFMWNAAMLFVVPFTL